MHVDHASPEPEKIALAAAEIRRGRLIAFPAEGVYGLGANALDENAVVQGNLGILIVMPVILSARVLGGYNYRILLGLPPWPVTDEVETSQEIT